MHSLSEPKRERERGRQTEGEKGAVRTLSPASYTAARALTMLHAALNDIQALRALGPTAAANVEGRDTRAITLG